MTAAVFNQSVHSSLSAKVLQPLLSKRRPQRMLMLSHVGATAVPLQPIRPLQIIRLVSDGTVGGAPLQCRLGALPFESDVFDLVVLQHLVSDGSEAVFSESLRVLAPGGDLLVSGLNASSLRYRLGNRDARFPGLRLPRVIHHLNSESFRIVGCQWQGLAGLAWPESKDGRCGRVLPFADYVVLHSHHESSMAVGNILRFKRVQPAGVVSAPLDACSSRVAEL